MNKNNKNGLRILSLTIKFFYLSILFVCVVSIGLCLYYKSEIGLEISFGALSGIVVTLVASFTSANNCDISTESYQLSCDYLLDLLKEEHSNQAHSGVSVYADGKDDGLKIGDLISNARNRIWILGTDLSNFTIKYGKDLVSACSKNHDIHVRILSIHPQNLFCNLRYSQLGWNNASMMSSSVNEACFSFTQLERDIQRINPSFRFDIRLYFAQPTVRIYLIDDILIISHFINGVRSSESVHISCDVNNHKDVAHDFLDAHFEDVWNDAIDINSIPELSNSQPVYSINKKGNIVEYSFKKRFFSTTIRSSSRLFVGKARMLITSHLPNLITPVIFTILAVLALSILKSSSIVTYTHGLSLNDYLTNMSLGFITGSLLSSIEYIIQATYKSYIQKCEKTSRSLASARMCNSFSQLLGPNFKEYGVSCCLNRNEANIKERILSAKKRVWIYATNNKYISTLGVDEQLKKKDVDVRFLMLSPKSLFVSTRFSEIPGKKKAIDFSEEISSNLQHLLFKYKRSYVKMRIYYDNPTFMMYLIDDVLIVSPILRQGRSRDQVHFVFDLQYPDVKNDTMDYINHFTDIWNRSEKLTSRSIKSSKNNTYIAVIGDHLFDAIPRSFF